MKRDPSNKSSTLFRIAIVLASSLFGLLVAQSFDSHFPKQFRSTVTLQVKDDAASQPREVESNLIQRKEILYPVIDSLDLLKSSRFSKTPSREAIYFKLRDELAVTQLRNTELIQISITDPDPQLAASLANAIAQEYQHRRQSEQEEQVSLDMAALENEVAKQREKTEASRKRANQLRLEAGEKSESFLTADNDYKGARKILDAAEQRLSRERDRIITSHPPARVLIWEKAEPSSLPVSSPPIFRLALGAILGASIGLLLSLFVRKG
ncbi:hypothetical protein BH09VER1_BH09VER1_13900 [soil metagenome]